MQHITRQELVEILETIATAIEHNDTEMLHETINDMHEAISVEEQDEEYGVVLKADFASLEKRALDSDTLKNPVLDAVRKASDFIKLPVPGMNPRHPVAVISRFMEEHLVGSKVLAYTEMKEFWMFTTSCCPKTYRDTLDFNDFLAECVTDIDEGGEIADIVKRVDAIIFYPVECDPQGKMSSVHIAFYKY